MLRRASLQQGQETRARLEMPKTRKKLVKFTSLSDYQEHFVHHKDQPVNRPCSPKGRLIDPVPHEQQVEAVKALEYQPRYPWWKTSEFATKSEAAEAYTQKPIEKLDAQANSTRNYASDFKLFAHRSMEPEASRECMKSSESQQMHQPFTKEEIQKAKAVLPAGLTVEAVTHTRTVPVDPEDRWWENSPFEFTSESRAHFKPTPANFKRQVLSEMATGEHQDWYPDRRIAVVPGSLGPSQASSAASDM